ncbi:hypothetical protein Acsp04_63820 [Actinomadura sp. NBRC 104425]|uniref:hypothetical protein n=1 Tax=Actinomadura sp. NBRC 104425 TaxID=3032204 RepID=UPI0024A20B1C|nr:hypothetical protein [Actinomadura sp. NBRC 104425]GLZ16147.1 hypothetical protein Acsp04_63820 [Actinomadura sp. NBRC 104425]
MRLARWEPWVRDVLAASPAVAEVAPFAEAGIDHKPCGTTIRFATGAQVYVQWVRASGAGDDHSVPEEPVTGTPPEPVTVPDLPTSGRLPMRQVEQHLAALINNAGSPEIKSVTGKAAAGEDGPRPYGLEVQFHSGHTNYGLFLHTLPAGAKPTQEGEFQQRKEI